MTETAAGVKGNGIGVTDGDWNIGVVEDLGGGLKAGANMALRLRGRDAATDALSGGSLTDGNGARPRDTSMYVSGGFGTVLVGAVEAGNGLLPLLGAGGPVYIGLDNGAQLAAATNTDLLQYTSPAFSGLTVRAALLDNVGGNGAESVAKTQDARLIGLNYAAGPLSAAVDFTSYGLNSVIQPAVTGAFTATGVTLPAAAVTVAADSRTRLSASYDLGVARVGAGYQTAKTTAGIKKNETAVSVSAPFGPIVAGVIYASSKTDGVAGNNTGFDLGVQYNLSKRTYVALQAQSTKGAGATASATNTRIQLGHSF